MLLISCALLLAALVPVAAQAYEGEKIYAKKLKKSVSEISVVDYGQGGADGMRGYWAGRRESGSTARSLMSGSGKDIRPGSRQRSICPKSRFN